MFDKKFDIITFGSATRDINVVSKAFTVIDDKKDFATGEGICLALGSKIDIENIRHSSGGGGTNVAATFAKQGFKTAFCGAIGTDLAGLEIVKELKNYKIDLRFLAKKKEKATNQSVILSGGGEDRTILAYRGASELLDKKTIPFKKLKTTWMYLAPLTGLLCDNFEELVNFASKKKIKLAVNPSEQQLSLPPEILKKIFEKTDILFVNQEEAAFLTKVPFENETEILRALNVLCSGIVVMTKGADGVVVLDRKNQYRAKPNSERNVVDTTGAGDSFASGFLCAFIRTNGNIEKAIQLGMGNSEANLKEFGAKEGILAKDQAFEAVPVIKEVINT